MDPKNNGHVKPLRLTDLQRELREEILGLISDKNLALEDVVVYEYGYVPIRLQEVISRLASKDIMIIGSLVYGEKLYVIGLRGKGGGIGMLFEANRR